MLDQDEVTMRDDYPINESLLQSYRRIFISSESFLLSAGILLLKDLKKPLLFYAIVVMNIIIILFGWLPIVRSRAKIVDFHKFRLRNKGFENSEKFLKNRKYRREAYIKVGKSGPWRLTRKKIDLFLPLMYLSVWILLFLIYEDPNNSVLWYLLGFPFDIPIWVALGVMFLVAIGVIWNIVSEFGNKNYSNGEETASQ